MLISSNPSRKYDKVFNRSDFNVIAVVVTYNPSLEGLIRLLSATSDQVAKILVIDNGSCDAKSVELVVATCDNADFIGLDQNMGIAYAQNVGFRIGYKHSADYVLTLDQDSVPERGMVSILTAVFHQAEDSERIAAVGPILLDEGTQLPLPFFSYRSGHKLRIMPKKGNHVIDVDFLVSSGTLLAMEAISEVGLMREELFISYVDVEWCLRARSLGYRLVASCAATMTHNLGERRLKIGRFLIPLHSPLRHFYLMRSGVYMQRLPHVSRTWKRADRLQLCRSFILFGIAGLPRFHELISMFRGIKEGLSMSIDAPIQLNAPELSLDELSSIQVSPVHQGCNGNTSVAVLMALYGKDHPDLFERALQSVLGQMLPNNYELHIYLGIDGPISPALEDIVRKYKKHLHLVSRSTTNVGLACTLNRLIAARGNESYFFRMDADDLSISGRFSAQLAYLDAKPDIDILGTAINECSSDGERRLVRFSNGPEDARRSIYRRVPVAHPTVCMRRRVFDIVGSYPDRRGNEDIAMWFKCLEAGLRFDNLTDAWLDFTITDAFWNRRNVRKAFIEFQSYAEGIWRLDGITWRYLFPLARLLLRLSPKWVNRRIYASRFRV